MDPVGIVVWLASGALSGWLVGWSVSSSTGMALALSATSSLAWSEPSLVAGCLVNSVRRVEEV